MVGPVNNEERQHAVDDLKGVEYYSALVNAWIATNQEASKTLVTLSVVAIGFLPTLLAKAEEISSGVLVLYGTAMFAFSICCITVIAVYRRNAVYLAKVVKGDVGSDSHLEILDKTTYFSFSVGVVLTFCLSIVIGYQKLQPINLEDVMSKDSSIQHGQVSFGDKSLNGISSMAPTPQAPQSSSPTASSSTGSSQSTGGSASGSGSTSSSAGKK
ncbi:hypothetical protein [Desulfotalea psychrophila]|uniref:Uncharacterized protein n=1 Tax=Desulfotalea psychrophila (strain LSv54 / DSM 12343) TaxID=177439 RepID=Q6APB6_DESPS|nr:hypothetical protein [Desulfotalea psychrophila]CAG35808.1 unknown protein [Desulfotalea psychrophila LSv54]